MVPYVLYNGMPHKLAADFSVCRVGLLQKRVKVQSPAFRLPVAIRLKQILHVQT